MSYIINVYSLILKAGFDAHDFYPVMFKQFVQVNILLDLEDDLPMGGRSRVLRGFGSDSPPQVLLKV